MPTSTTPTTTDWHELDTIVRGEPFVVERIRLTGKDIAVEGSFALPQLARLSSEDQIFITAFVRSHGSIKEMEQVFGVSYPTIKSRLTRIANSLEFVETDTIDRKPAETNRSEANIETKQSRSAILARLKGREIAAADA